MDPTGGGIGKAAGEMMKEMQEAQQQTQKQQDVGKPGGTTSFSQVQQSQQAGQVNQANQVNQVNQVNESQKVGQVQKSTNILQQAKLNANMPSTRVGQAARAKKSKVVDMLQGLIGGQDKMTQIMKVAMSGKKMAPQEMLAMQAGVYRFSQELELTSKVVEKATSGVKQTMNTQV